MGKQIAVMMGAICMDNQKKLLDGIVSYASERGVNVHVFTCHLNYEENEANKQGAFRIMELPDFSLYDGVVLVKNTIQYHRAAARLVERLKAVNAPVVNVSSELQGFMNIQVSGYHAQADIVEHLIQEHGLKRINYITGIVANSDSQERYQAYLDVMRRNGLEVSEKQVYNGHFNQKSGSDGVEWFLAQDSVAPEAIVCANDSMAIGAVSQLKKRGYRVPEDVAVTGFDNDELGKFCKPMLTTVDKDQYAMGRKAVEMLLTPELYEEPVVLKAEAVFCNSCGCREQAYCNTEKLAERYIWDKSENQNNMEHMKNMLSEFSGVKEPEELAECLKKYVALSDAEYFYLCMCDCETAFETMGAGMDEESGWLETNTEYTERMTVMLAYEKGSFVEYPPVKKGEVLPKQCRDHSSGDVFVMLPMYYQKYCYGYCAVGNSRYFMESEMLYLLVMGIAVGLENIRKRKLLQKAVNELRSMWAYDMLTHIYNRSGFFYYAEQELAGLKQRGENALVLFVDIDGLKFVNDTYGHKSGDRFIQKVAGILRESLAPGQMLMRYGGDEFVVFGACRDREQAQMQIGQIRQSMQEENRKEQDNFVLAASIGYDVCPAAEIENLNEVIELADEKMYAEKREKKPRAT
ncbi:MAG: GGDEF domain-containing protein [Acetatifactor muris]|nr:GGDEF domain-containing protein [Acetatifactor muris]